MAFIGQDNFIRADQSGWGTASDGQTYSQPVGTLVLSIVSNQGNVAGGSGATVIFFGSKTSADAQALCRMKFSATSNSLSLVLRATASNTFYFARYGNAVGQIDISKDIAGTITQLVTGSFAPAVSTLFWCRFQVIGSNLFAKWWLDGSGEPSSWTLSTTDSAISAAGQFGFRVAGTAGNNMDFDSYTVTDTLPLGIPRYIPRALGSTIIIDPVSQPLPYIDRGMLATIVYENRIFVPRALGGIYIPDDPTLLWVPRGIGSTTQIPTSVALSLTFAGIGTLTGPLSAALTLPTTTLAGIGTLAGTVGLTTALSTTFAGVGTLSGTTSLATSLSGESDGVGTLAGTLSTTGGISLSVTMAGVGTLAGTTTLTTALSTTLVGVGTLVGPLSANLTLPSTTLAGVGTLAGTSTLSTALTDTFAGVGTLSGTTTLKTALSTTFAGIGTLSGTLSVAGQVSLTGTLVGVGTLAGTLAFSTAFAQTFVGVGTLSGVFSLRVALFLTCAGVGALIPSLAVVGHPSHAQVMLQAARGIVVLQAARGTITLTAPRGKITLTGD